MSSQYKFFTRQYPYPLSKVPFPGGTFAKPFLPGDPLDLIPGEENFYILCATPEQVNAIQSSIEIGAPIGYSGSYNEIIQVFDQAVEFPNSFDGANCVNLCDLIIECINDPGSGVADAISNITLNQSASEYREYGQSENDRLLAGGSNPLCDPDVVWSQCHQLVEHFHDINLEIFAQIEVATNDYELVANVIGNITGIDETSIDAVLSWIEFILNNISENYVAQATVAYRDELACEIFCAVLNEDCYITPRVGYDILKNRLGSAVTLESLISEALEYVVTGSWSGEEIADVMFFSQFSLRSMLGLMLGIVGYNDTEMRLQIAVNDANNDWILLCDPCAGEFTHTFDFTTSQHGFSAFNGRALWDIGEGFKDNPNGSADNVVQIQRSGFGSFDLISIEFVYTGVVGLCGSDPSFIVRANDVGGGVFSGEGDETEPTITANLETVTGLWLSMCTDSGSQRIQQIIVKGIGTNPFS